MRGCLMLASRSVGSWRMGAHALPGKSCCRHQLSQRRVTSFLCGLFFKSPSKLSLIVRLGRLLSLGSLTSIKNLRVPLRYLFAPLLAVKREELLD